MLLAFSDQYLRVMSENLRVDCLFKVFLDLQLNTNVDDLGAGCDAMRSEFNSGCRNSSVDLFGQNWTFLVESADPN